MIRHESVDRRHAEKNRHDEKPNPAGDGQIPDEFRLEARLLQKLAPALRKRIEPAFVRRAFRNAHKRRIGPNGNAANRREGSERIKGIFFDRRVLKDERDLSTRVALVPRVTLVILN